ncbi:hypothetical protein [Limnohabitans lacus]|uniref:Uncharacterized protein n=1 Tax=Limnohabitans lacus TaxID=3045173 RepID=A0ABT6X944_9BURK|nr:hypothetical protein [Limnohabitans sp. HM2-2]MDI9234586.1 hypothetical protein [Limnohabitans sp. HM2-2]
MPDLDELLGKGNASVIAPAGHGKTELIAKLAAVTTALCASPVRLVAHIKCTAHGLDSASWRMTSSVAEQHLALLKLRGIVGGVHGQHCECQRPQGSDQRVFLDCALHATLTFTAWSAQLVLL